MPRGHRRSTPKVKDGQVLKKNRHLETPSYRSEMPQSPVIDKERPGQGYLHVVSKSDIEKFIRILPDWGELSKGLRAVLMAKGEPGCDGWYGHDGLVAICAWRRDLWRSSNEQHFVEHQQLYERLGVPSELEGGNVLCKFTRSTAKAYLLLHVFLHELGHHRDLITTKKKTNPGRGEGFAEEWAFKHEAFVWDAYVKTFGDPRYGK